MDLAHVGPRFGDPEPNTAESLAAVGTADQDMLEAVVAGDPTGFYASVAHDGDRRRICGLSPIYTFLRALPGVARPAHPLPPVARSPGRGDLLRRGVSVTASPDSAPPPTDPSKWTLPRLRITRDGEWLHDGEEVTHAGILANLRESLRVDERGHYLQIGPARVPVEVDDAPFVVLRVEPEGDRLMLTLNDFSREPLAARRSPSTRQAFPTAESRAGVSWPA